MAEPIALSQLARELQLGPREHIALVGGGGKTTMLHALGNQLDGSVILTTTTKMGSEQAGGFPTVITDEAHTDTLGPGTSIVWNRVKGNKAFGITREQCDRWAELANHVVIEADGARRKPFKAPASYEPVIPGSVTLVISVIGADALGRVIADQCHRPLRVAALAQCEPYQRLSPSGAAKVLVHPRGARREVPPAARFVVAITKVDDDNSTLVDHLVAELHSLDPHLQVIPIRNSRTTKGR